MDNPPQQEAPPPVAPARIASRAGLLKKSWPWLLVVLLAAAGAWFHFGAGKPAVLGPQGGKPAGSRAGFDANRPTPVATAPARSGDIRIHLNGLGTVTPLNTVTVRSRVEGELTQVLFQEGQVVRAGDLLAQIDPRPFQVQVAQAEGTLARDVALLRNAQADLERYRVLFEQDSIARQQLDTQAALVRQYEGTLKADQAAIDNARLQLAYSRITAPIGGRLGLRQVDPGNIVRASDASGLVVITQLQPIGVIFTLPEDNLPPVMKRLQAGEKLVVDAFDRAGKVRLAGGTLLTVDNQIDPATGTVKLKAQFSNEDYGLFPNQFVNARLLLETRRDVVLIPASAVQRGSATLQYGGSFVYVARPDNTVTVRPVKPGPAEGETLSIEEGLAPGEVVVIDGTDKLREGAKIEVPGSTGTRDVMAPGSAGTRDVTAPGSTGTRDVMAPGPAGTREATAAGAGGSDAGGEHRRRRDGAAN
jgi:multidrug efflux system membrane fusion protein